MVNWLNRVFRRNEEIDWMFDLDLLKDTSERAYLKKLAIQICVNHIADTVSQSRFKVRSKNEGMDKHIEYLLNQRPNRNQNASQFWQQVIYKLINDNEVLIIQTDSEELVIADDFVKEDFTFYDSVFKNVTAVGHTWERNFLMSDVFYLEYSNGQMKQIIDGLFDDYSEIFGRLVKYQLHAHQLRATFSLGTLGRKTQDTRDKFQGFVDKLTESFSKNTVAVVPLQDGTEYKEHSSGGSTQSVEEVNKALNGFIDKVAMALKIPKSLLYGDMADTNEASKNYMKFCVNPLIKQISDEFTSKLFERSEIEQKNYKLEIYPMTLENVFERATAIDKLISSSAYTPNEIRIKMGDEPSDDPKMNEHIRTKNYESVDEEASRGGETNT